MRRVWLLAFVFVALLPLADHNGARANSADTGLLSPVASAPNVQLARVYVRGPYGGRAVVGPRGAVVRGPRGGGYVVGRRYYGGVWYGTGRRYWRGRWWPYGVGSCWRASPIGYVWICG
jgi:hypothetical protein